MKTYQPALILPPDPVDKTSVPVSTLDALMAISIQKSDIVFSRSTFNTKWWDYYRLHPMQALHLAHKHSQLAVQKWRPLFGGSIHDGRPRPSPILDRHRSVDGKRMEWALAPTARRTALWRLVCIADHYGIPYDFWIDQGYKCLMGARWSRLPAISQLYTTKTVQTIIKQWGEECDHFMHLPKDPIFLAENFDGSPVQIRFQRWLLGLLKTQSSPVHGLRHYLTKEPFLHVKIAGETLGDELVDLALARS